MGTRSRLLIVLLGLATFLLIAASGSLPLPWKLQPDAQLVLAQDLTSTEATIANCRYGATPLSEQQVPVVADLGAGWYLDFNSYLVQDRPANNAKYVPMVRIYQDKELIQTDPTKQCNCPDDYRYLDSYTTFPKLNQQFANQLKQEQGQTVIVGNEVERFGQGETYPEMFAEAYHDVYQFIKQQDRTAQVAATALVQFTPNRQQYLDKVWAHYLATYGSYMPVDAWTMHVYVLPELRFDGSAWVPNGIASVGMGTNPALGKKEGQGNPASCGDSDVYCYSEHDDINAFSEQVVAMRQWMKNHGQQNKPLLLSEFSILYPYETDGNGVCEFLIDENGQCFTPSRVNNFMNTTINYLKNAKDPNLGYPLDDNRLIQQWMWFSIYNPSLGRVSNLVTNDTGNTYTAVGSNFKNLIAADSLTKNLIVNEAADVLVATNGQSNTSAMISVTFTNNGSEAIKSPFKVSFYRNASMTDLIGSVNVAPRVEGCASYLYKAELQWGNLNEGTYDYYVKVDSDNKIGETTAGDTDNVGQGTVRVVANDIKLPLIRSRN